MSPNIKKRKLKIVLAVLVGLFAIGLVTLLALANNKRSGSSNVQSSEQKQWLGKQAPEFALKDGKGKEIKLTDYRGKKVVLFFNEGLMCYPACWNQMAALGQDNQLNNSEIATVSIVNDSVSEWDGVFSKMPELATETVLFDTDRSVSKKYNVLSLSSSMHPGNRSGHTYFIVDGEGIIRFVLDDPQMAVRNAELLDEIKKMNN